MNHHTRKRRIQTWVGLGLPFLAGMVMLIQYLISINNENKEITVAELKRGSFTDPRDRQTYQWTEMKDGLIWMAENLRFETDNSWCKEIDSDCSSYYGRYYSWEAALRACPEGWRLPSAKEIRNLRKKHGAPLYHYKEIMELLSIKPTGYRDPQIGFRNIKGRGAQFWSLTEDNKEKARIMRFSYEYTTLKTGIAVKDSALPCRCIRDK